MARPRKNAAAKDGSGTACATARPKPKPKPKRAGKGERRPSSQRSSTFRGVTRHRWTGRFEAHLWDRDTWNREPQAKKKKGKQVYLGAYDDEEAAARAHDLAALKYWGPGTVLNFPLCSYDEELKEMAGQTREEYVGSVRRKSSGFSRGVSKYRGVARHHYNGRWEARIGRVLGNKYLYLGTYATQEAAAVAYDIAAIEHRGLNAVTNFDISHYVNWHRRRRRLLGEDGLGAAVTMPVQLPNDLTEHARATDETLAAADAAFDDGEHNRHQYHIADSFIAQLPDHDEARMPTSPALDQLLLLQSTKFEEIMEQATVAAAESSSASSPSPCTSSSSPSSLSQPSPERQPESSSGGGASSAAPCSFPDDVQTYFDFECDDGMNFEFAEVDTFLFGDLGAYAAPMFQCDLDGFV